MDGDAVGPPLRQHVQFAADRKAGAQALDRLVDQCAFAALHRRYEQRHRRHERVRERRVEAVEQEFVALAVAGGDFHGGLDRLRDAFVAAFSGGSVVENGAAETAEIATHDEGEQPLRRGEVLVGLDDREKRIGSRREMSEMIAGRSHDEVEIAVDLAAVALGDHRLERGRGLFEGDPGARPVAAQLDQAKAEAEQSVSIGMQIVAELRRERRRIRRQSAVAPDDRARLAARDQVSPETGGRRFGDVRRDCLRACGHRRPPCRRLRR